MTRSGEAALHAFVEGRRTALFRWGCSLLERSRELGGAYLLCGNRDEAEDLVQTTLVKAGFLGGGSQGPLLKTFPLTREQLGELALNPELLP